MVAWVSSGALGVLGDVVAGFFERETGFEPATFSLEG